jgi:hypothetical protein
MAEPTNLAELIAANTATQAEIAAFVAAAEQIVESGGAQVSTDTPNLLTEGTDGLAKLDPSAVVVPATLAGYSGTDHLHTGVYEPAWGSPVGTTQMLVKSPAGVQAFQPIADGAALTFPNIQTATITGGALETPLADGGARYVVDVNANLLPGAWTIPLPADPNTTLRSYSATVEFRAPTTAGQEWTVHIPSGATTDIYSETFFTLKTGDGPVYASIETLQGGGAYVIYLPSKYAPFEATGEVTTASLAAQLASLGTINEDFFIFDEADPASNLIYQNQAASTLVTAVGQAVQAWKSYGASPVTAVLSMPTAHNHVLRRTSTTEIYAPILNVTNNYDYEFTVDLGADSLGENCVIATAEAKGPVIRTGQSLGTTFSFGANSQFVSRAVVTRGPIDNAQRATISAWLAQKVPTIGPELISNPSMTDLTDWTTYHVSSAWVWDTTDPDAPFAKWTGENSSDGIRTSVAGTVANELFLNEITLAQGRSFNVYFPTSRYALPGSDEVPTVPVAKSRVITPAPGQSGTINFELFPTAYYAPYVGVYNVSLKRLL